MDKDAIFEVIIGHTREVLPQLVNNQFQRSDSLRDLGANSIDRSEILMMTLESLSLPVPLVTLARAKNIGELADILYDQLQSA